MLRVGLKFKQIVSGDVRSLDRYLVKLRRRSAWQRLTGRKPVSTSLPPTGEAERRDKRRVQLENKGELIALVESVSVADDGSLSNLTPAMGVDRVGEMALTGRMSTYNIDDITTDGCSFTTNDQDEFVPGALVQLQIVGEELSLGILAKVVEAVTRPDS